MAHDVTLLMHDRDLPAASGRVFERHNPITGAVATRAVAATVEDAEAAATSAAAAFPAWSRLGPAARRAKLLAAAAELERRQDDFLEAMAEEIGATELWGRFNVELAASILREAASLTTAVAGELIPSDKPGLLAMALRQPVGVILALAPWNAPVILGVRGLAMPLACGNTAVLKASEICPRTHLLIGEIFRRAGLGDGVVNVITNAPADASRIVEALIAHPTVRRINFTGSTRVGRHVAEIAARHLKPALLELGGKAPLRRPRRRRHRRGRRRRGFRRLHEPGPNLHVDRAAHRRRQRRRRIRAPPRGQSFDSRRRRPAQGEDAARRA